jgi:hypothetical protein
LRARSETGMPIGTMLSLHLPAFAANHRIVHHSSVCTAFRPGPTLCVWTSYFVLMWLPTQPAKPFQLTALMSLALSLQQRSPLYHNLRHRNQHCKRTCRPDTLRFHCICSCIYPRRRTACTQASRKITLCSWCCKNSCLWARTHRAVARDSRGIQVLALA